VRACVILLGRVRYSMSWRKPRLSVSRAASRQRLPTLLHSPTRVDRRTSLHGHAGVTALVPASFLRGARLLPQTEVEAPRSRSSVGAGCLGCLERLIGTIFCCFFVWLQRQNICSSVPKLCGRDATGCSETWPVNSSQRRPRALRAPASVQTSGVHPDRWRHIRLCNTN